MLALSLIAITVAFVAGLVRGSGFARFTAGKFLFSTTVKSRNTWQFRVAPDGLLVVLDIEADGLGSTQRVVFYDRDETDELMAPWVQQSGAAERLAQKQETSNG